jgi:hypothetical protein
MGMLKRMKDMRDMVQAAPGMVAQAQQLGAQAQEYAAAQQAAVQAQYGQAPYGQAQFGQPQSGQPQFGQAAAAAPAGPDFEPISGVSLEQFVAVSKGVAAFDYDQSMLPEVAAAKGIAAATWDIAAKGWNERIHANPAVAQRFNKIYRES